MNFVAIDVETAQGSRWSICQIATFAVINNFCRAINTSS